MASQQGFLLRFSLRTRVMLAFSVMGVALIVISNYLYFESVKSTMVQDYIRRYEVLSQDINIQVASSVDGQQTISSLLSDRLRDDCITIQNALPKHASDVTTEQLQKLTKQLNISGITLFVPTKDKTDIVGVRSTDPKEIGLSTNKWGSWYTAFQQLIYSAQHQTNVPEGEKGDHYYSGPWANASSDPTKIDKWGYYFDGSTDYMIDPWIESTYAYQYGIQTSPQNTIRNLLRSDPDLLEITAFNPESFGKDPIKDNLNGSVYVDFKRQPIFFGTYTYRSNTDVQNVQSAMSMHHSISVVETVNGKTVMKTFVPLFGITGGSNKIGQDSYVLSFVSDYGKVASITRTLIVTAILLSFGMMVIIVFASIWLSGTILKPIRRIAERISRISLIQFDENLELVGNDEIGDLSSKLNVMIERLRTYTDGLKTQVRNERTELMEYLGFLSSGLIHELRNPLASIEFFLSVFPKLQPLNEKSQEALQHMKDASAHANVIVNDFSSFMKNGNLNLQCVDVFELVKYAIENNRSYAESRHINLELQNELGLESIYSNIDSVKIQHVVSNVLRNGMDAIPENHNPRIVTVVVTCETDEVNIDVTDTGHGIPEEHWETVFFPYQTEKKQGYGIGLALCRYLTLAHGGRIFVLNSSCEGTTFRIVLPRQIQ